MSAAAGDERSRLLRALALSRRFHLLLAYVESPRAADQLVRALAEELPRLRKAPVELVRLDPYEGRETDAPLEDVELADRILIPLLSPTEERRAHGVVHVVDASRATPADTEAWGRLFALWNEKRNALQQLGGEVLVVLPEPLQRLFATAAPDVWSIRSGEYAVGEEAVQLEAMRMRGGPAAERREALSWYRALPPLALFGGDLVVEPLLKNIVIEADVEPRIDQPAIHDEIVSEEVHDQRTVRRAEHALAQRRFSDAADIFALLSKHPSVNVRRRADDTLCVALAAQDHAHEAWAQYAHGRASAYVQWCLGHLDAAAGLEGARLFGADEAQSWDLRLVERGMIAVQHDGFDLIHVDSQFLAGDLRRAARLKPYYFRSATMLALVEIARGNESRAAALLNRTDCHVEPPRGPEATARVSAFHAYVSGLLHEERQNLQGALSWFTRARAHVAEWSLTGFDRRSLHRASLAIDLAHATLDPSRADRVGIARELVDRARSLLGDTAEDFIARVLAVETRRELARRLADIGDEAAAAEAHRALDLARPLAGRGVPAWDAIFAATEREALTQSMT